MEIDEEMFSKQVDRNLEGIALEKKNMTEEAIKLYEENIKEGFIGTHPYDRLTIIYKRQKQKSNEVRVLERAIEVFSKTSTDPILATEKYRVRLNKALKK